MNLLINHNYIKFRIQIQSNISTESKKEKVTQSYRKNVTCTKANACNCPHNCKRVEFEQAAFSSSSAQENSSWARETLRIEKSNSSSSRYYLSYSLTFIFSISINYESDIYTKNSTSVGAKLIYQQIIFVIKLLLC
jgi:hypothetical protein